MRLAAVAPVRANAQRNWRYVVGTFQVKIPVAEAKAILPAEENTYTIVLWRFNQMSPGNRWYPVIERYLTYLAGRIDGLGGDAGSISPSPGGAGGGPGIGGGPGFGGGPETQVEEFTGKIVGVIYDRFGDFEGFLLLTEAGHERAFSAREAEIEELVRFAWRDRVVISVLVRPSHPEHPISIILRRAPDSER